MATPDCADLRGKVKKCKLEEAKRRKKKQRRFKDRRCNKGGTLLMRFSHRETVTTQGPLCEPLEPSQGGKCGLTARNTGSSGTATKRGAGSNKR